MDKIIMAINEVIEKRGVTKKFVALKTGMTIDNISKICNGKRKITADEFLKLCDVLEIDIEQFRQPKAV